MSADVEMTDAANVAASASASASSAAGAAPSVVSPVSSDSNSNWSSMDSLILIAAVQKAHAARNTDPVAAANKVPIQSLLDWPGISQLLQSKSHLGASPSLSTEACLQRFSQLLNDAKLVASLTAVSLADLTAAFTPLLHRLVSERMMQLESEVSQAALKQQRIELGMSHAQHRLAMQQANQQAATANATAAPGASPVSSPTAAAPTSPVAVASSQSGAITVKLESLSSARPSALLSPTADARPSPLIINSPSLSSLNSAGWPAGSSLHTPLKSISMSGGLMRQTSTPNAAATAAAAASGLQSPTLTRQQSTPLDSVVPPFTPTPPPILLSQAKINELFDLILSTLTSRAEADAFLLPVDPAYADNYYEVIKQPMSFQDVTSKVKDGEITTPMEFWNAVNQIYINCYAYNDKKTTYFKQAKVLEAITLDLFKKHFPMYTGPWEKKSVGGGRPPKYTSVAPPTPSLTSSNSVTSSSVAASPASSPNPSNANNIAPIPLNLGTSASPAAASSPQQTSNASPASPQPLPSNAVPTTPSTPTRKNLAPRSLTNSGSDSVAAASDDLPPVSSNASVASAGDRSSSMSRRGSVQSTAGRKRATLDVDGDEEMVASEAESASVAAGADNDSGGEDAGGSIHDALSTPARGAGNQRKRGAAALNAAAGTPTATPNAAATPGSRKPVRSTGRSAQPATPAAATPAPQTPSSNASAGEEQDDSAGMKRRGRPPKK